MAKNNNLHRAMRIKNDEFYTTYEDIEKELSAYDFTDMVVYLNCDNPNTSNFYKYFSNNFNKLSIRKVITTHLKDEGAYKNEFDGVKEVKTFLQGNGDFRSDECVALLKEADIVVSNPPFSLFRDYISLLLKHQKKFIIVGNTNSIFCKEIFPYYQRGELWLGRHKLKKFLVPDEYEADNVKIENDRKYAFFGNIGWYSNVEGNIKEEKLSLTEVYGDGSSYKKYENYDAIEVSKLKLIPKDYYGIMGVPISFTEKHCPSQFKIIWQASGNTRNNCPPEILKELGYTEHPDDKGGAGIIDGKRVYSRIFIRRID